MKTLILITLATMTISGTAYARGEHCRSQDNSCQQNYRKADAFKVLYEIEGNPNDATANLNVIEQANQKYRLGFEPAVGNFIYLLNVLGGMRATIETQSIFSELASMTGNRLGLAELVDAFTDLYHIEGSHPDSMQGLRAAYAFSVKERAPFAVGARLYTDILNLLGGMRATTDALPAFAIIAPNTRDFRARELFEAFQEIYFVEGSVQDTTENFKLVVRAAIKCGSLYEAKEEFLSLLNSLGGMRATIEAQRTYREIFGL